MRETSIQEKDMLKITSRIGNVLIIIQKTEALLKASIIVSLGSSDADNKLIKILNEDKLTLGMLLQQMKLRVELPNDFSTTLIEFLHLRNLFIHKLFMQDWFDLKTSEGLLAMEKFLSTLLSKGAIAIRIFVAYGSKSNSQLLKENMIMFDKLIERIILTASPDFGGKSFEQYTDDFSKDVSENYSLKK
jgi:hypothetical protein